MDDSMKNELLKSAKGILDLISNGVQSGAAFAKQQLPDIANQYLAWGLYDSISTAVMCALFSAISIYVFYNMLKNKWKLEDSYGWHAGRIIGCTAGGLIGVPSIVGFFCSLSEILKITVAPKVWLLQHIVELIK